MQSTFLFLFPLTFWAQAAAASKIILDCAALLMYTPDPFWRELFKKKIIIKPIEN